MDDTNTRGLRSAAVRQGNLATILELLHERGPVSRSQLVSHSGLTRSAIGGLVADLAELGFVTEEQSSSQGRPGRPSSSVVPLSRTNAAISVVIMVDSITVTAVGLGGVQLAAAQTASPNTGLLVEETLDDIVSLLHEVRQQLDPAARIFGIGVAVPGLVRHADDCVVVAPNIDWSNVSLGPRLREHIGASIPVLVRNEANVGALAEFRRGAAAGYNHVLYVSGEVGVGGGIIANGELLTGGSGFAGEIGHLHVNNDGRRCGCGALGCWESEVGEEALLVRGGLPAAGGETAVEELLASAGAGEEAAQSALAEHGRWVGIGLASLINVLNPDVVVFGGLFAQTFEKMRATMEAELSARSLRAVRERCVVLASSLGVAALPLGAAELVWDVVLDDPGRAALRTIPAVERR